MGKEVFKEWEKKLDAKMIGGIKDSLIIQPA